MPRSDFARISRRNIEKLLELKRAMNIKSIDGVVGYLVSEIMSDF